MVGIGSGRTPGRRLRSWIRHPMPIIRTAAPAIKKKSPGHAVDIKYFLRLGVRSYILAGNWYGGSKKRKFDYRPRSDFIYEVFTSVTRALATRFRFLRSRAGAAKFYLSRTHTSRTFSSGRDPAKSTRTRGSEDP